MKEDVFCANKEVTNRETAQMEGVEDQAEIEREDLQVVDIAIEEVMVLGVQVKIQEVQIGEEVMEEENSMEVDHRIVKVMEGTEVQEHEDKIETTDEEDHQVEEVNSATSRTQKKLDVRDPKKADETDPKKADRDSEKIITKIEFQGGQSKKKAVVSTKQSIGKEVHQQSRKSDKKVRKDQKTENE